MRGDSAHYAGLAKKSQASRISRYVEMTVLLRAPGAQIPTRSRDTDAGYDIYAVADVKLVSGIEGKVDTGISVTVPPGYFYTLAPRSSLLRHGINVRQNVIDATYTGPISAYLTLAAGRVPYIVKAGDRVAQILIFPQIHAKVRQVRTEQELWKGEGRGAAGYGSSGR